MESELVQQKEGKSTMVKSDGKGHVMVAVVAAEQAGGQGSRAD